MKWFKETPFSLWAIILGYGMLHIPFLFSGFGEPDGWRNGSAALCWAKDLGYIPGQEQYPKIQPKTLFVPFYS